MKPDTELCRRMFLPHNIETAISNVKRSKGGACVDGMEVGGIGGYMEDSWTRIEEQILARTYRPKLVKRIEIQKDNDGVRLLKVNCVIDRVEYKEIEFNYAYDFGIYFVSRFFRHTLIQRRETEWPLSVWL